MNATFALRRYREESLRVVFVEASLFPDLLGERGDSCSLSRPCLISSKCDFFFEIHQAIFAARCASSCPSLNLSFGRNESDFLHILTRADGSSCSFLSVGKGLAHRVELFQAVYGWKLLDMGRNPEGSGIG